MCIGADTIALEVLPSQIPALLQFTPGVEYTQSGVYDINFNTRGFNNLLSRRVMTLVDGRDTSAPESSVQEWYSMGFLAADLESIERICGAHIDGAVARRLQNMRFMKQRDRNALARM